MGPGHRMVARGPALGCLGYPELGVQWLVCRHGGGVRWLGLPGVLSWLWGWTRVHAAPMALGSWGGRCCDRPGAASSPTPCSAADPSPGGPALEERVAQEALEALQLEKRLSLLSHSGRPGSGGRAMTRSGAGGASGAGRGGPAALGLAPPL